MTNDASQLMLRRWRVWGPGIVGAAFLSNLIVHAYLGTYSRFIADDYCSAGIAKKFGVLRAVWYWYLNWTGRYSASALDAVFGLLGPRVTPFVTAAVLLLWLAVLACAAAAFSGAPLRQRLLSAVMLALPLLYLTLILSPNVPQSLYWGQGMRSIVPPLILSAAYSVMLAWFIRKQQAPSLQRAWVIVAFVLTLLSGGLNETFAALQMSALVFTLVLVVVAVHGESGRRGVQFVIAGLLGSAVAVALVIAAPGNAYRQAFYPPPPGLLGMLRISAPNFLVFLARTFSSPERLTAVIGGIGLSAFLGAQAAPVKRSPWLVAAILALGLGLAFLCFLPAAYGLSDVPPERTLLIPSYIIAAALILASFVAGNQIAFALRGRTGRSRSEVVLLVIGAALSLSSVALSDSALLANRAEYASYAAHWDEVNSQIISARDAGQSQVLISTMPNWAGLNEPNDNPKFWVDVCYRQYYGIEVLASDQ
jgi:Family of unknown function (DUF6056)